MKTSGTELYTEVTESYSIVINISMAHTNNLIYLNLFVSSPLASFKT